MWQRLRAGSKELVLSRNSIIGGAMYVTREDNINVL